MKKTGKNKNGFTIIEAIISIFILTVGIIACAILADQVFRSSEVAKDRLIAVNLAQEGVEIIRNIRDNNWLASNSWNTNIPEGEREVSYASVGTDSYSGAYLKIDSDGFYNYSSGTNTTFQRKVTVFYTSEYETKVEVTVYWVTRGTSKNIALTESFYDWK